MQRDKISQLGQEVREELDRRLIAGAFANYDAQQEWLENRCKELGIDQKDIPSRSSIHRHGQKLQKHINAIKFATDGAKAIAEAAGDGADMGKALTALAQQKVYDVMMVFDPDPQSFDFIKGVRAIAELNKSDVQISKYRNEIKAKSELAAKEIDIKVRSAGLDESTAAEIRQKILGIAA